MASDQSAARAAPDGFALTQSRGKFTLHNGPIYRATAPGDLRSGFYVLDRHCNGMGFLHGGMASAFADGALAWAVWHAADRASVTLRLTLTFFDIVPQGAWLEARPQVRGRVDDTLSVHAELLRDGDKAAARADAVFRLVRRRPKT